MKTVHIESVKGSSKRVIAVRPLFETHSDGQTRLCNGERRDKPLLWYCL